MKYLVLTAFTAIIMTLSCGGNTVVANSQYVETQLHDITGDKIKDTIIIQGTYLKEKSLDLKNVSLQIVDTKRQQTFSFPLPIGSKPFLSITDFNHDGVKDVFVTIYSNSNDHHIKGFVYSFRDGQQVNLLAPLPVDVQASLQDHYQAKIVIGKKEYKIDASSNKKTYEKLGVYNKGKLNEPMELMVSGYSTLKATYMLQGHGLIGKQTVTGAFKEDVLGEVISTWLLENKEWKLKKVYFKKSKKK
jgi:hypothetical protein